MGLLTGTGETGNTMELDSLILESHGKFVTVRFIKKDGSVRTMLCRTGVKKYLKGGVSTLDPDKFLTVFDVSKGDYRAVNRQTILSVTFQHVSWLPERGTQENKHV